MQTRKAVQEVLWMTLGTLLVAFGVYFFKFPNHFSTGGVSGLGVVLGNLLPQVTPGTIVSFINVFFLVLGFLIFHRDFGLKTVYCSLLFSAVLQVLEWFWPLSHPLTDEKLLELFFAVLLPALGSAILFHTDASTGGTDVAAMILKKFTSLDIGKALLCSDILIAASTFWVFDVETGLFSILGLVLKSVLVDSTIESLNRKKSFTIITSRPQLACDYITHELHRGATVWEAQGAYTSQTHWVVLAVLSRGQALVLRRYLKANDPSAFMLITNSSEIFGKGFLRA